MIIKRYLAKEVYTHLCVITGILVLIFLSNQLVRFLSRAAAGKLTGGMLLKIMALEIPILVGFLLPVGTYVAILLAYGRLYVDSEMTVLEACGVSQRQLLRYTQFFALAVFLVVLIMTFYITPWVMRDKNKILATNPASLIISTLVPGRFQTITDQNVVYVEDIDHNKAVAENIFIARLESMTVNENKNGQSVKVKVPIWRILSADKAYQMESNEYHGSFIVAENGMEYSGVPGQRNFRVVHFEKYGARIPSMMDTVKTKLKYDTLSTSQLLKEAFENKKAMAELQWRISIPLSIPILVLLAVPLSRVNPRQGRYRKLIPAILLYTIYANMQFVMRDWIEDGVISTYIGMWPLHLLLLLTACVFYIDKHQWQRYLQVFRFRNKTS